MRARTLAALASLAASILAILVRLAALYVGVRARLGLRKAWWRARFRMKVRRLPRDLARALEEMYDRALSEASLPSLRDLVRTASRRPRRDKAVS